MLILLVSIYAAVSTITFKLVKIPINKWTLSTAVGGGAAVLFLLSTLMNYNHPFTQEARIYFYTTPIIPAVQGPVIEVPVEPNKMLKKGETLFKVDPRPYEYTLQRKRALLVDAEQSVKQLEVTAIAAAAKVKQESASRDRAKLIFDRYKNSFDQASNSKRAAAISELEVDQQRDSYLAAEDTLANAISVASQAQLAYRSEIEGVNTGVARLQAEVKQAQYDLDQTVLRAPTDGYVTQLFLRPGMMVSPSPSGPVMVFIHNEDQRLIGAFQQNVLQRIALGNAAEVTFDALPGKVFAGRVNGTIDVVSLGQLQPTGNLLDTTDRIGQGRLLAEIVITEDMAGYRLPGGAAAQVAIYSEHWRGLALLRQILLRMKGWENYLL